MTTTESEGLDREFLALESGPELIFRVAQPVAEGEAVSSSMPAGPWLNGPSGRPLAGAIGVLLALFRQQGRWVSRAPDATPASDTAEARAYDASAGTPVSGALPEDLTELLGTPSAGTDGSAYLDLAVTRAMVNPLGNLHGGITLCACDLVAQAALGAVAGPSRITSIHVAYPRPVPEGTAVRFEGGVLHRGCAFAITQVTALSESGKPCVISTISTGAPA
jgi:uncharacterized protein (TIGR00369 family)